MNDADIYRKLSANCLERARLSSDPDAMAGLIRLGQHWLRKAIDAGGHDDKNAVDRSAT
jgi:hypothetical protein